MIDPTNVPHVADDRAGFVVDHKVDLSTAYRTEPMSKSWYRLVPRRRSGDYSLPLTRDRVLSIEGEFRIGDELLTKFGLSNFVGGSNAESPSRPIPTVFRASDTDAITNVVVPRLPDLFRWLAPQVRAPWQSYTEQSRLGPPYYKPYDDKRWVLSSEATGLLQSYLSMDYSILDNFATGIGQRIQAEDINKPRVFTFLNPSGVPYQATLNRKDIKVNVWNHPRHPGRQRNVFNQGSFNLLNQAVDSAFNDVYGRHPAFHHDVARAGAMVKGPVLAFDVSHMERLTARIVFERAAVIGGTYDGFQRYMKKMPYLVPTDDWSRAFFIWVNYEDGWMAQFGSGNSAVSPSQKDIFMVLYSLFAEQCLGVPREKSFDWVAAGGNERLRIFNFGDDNFIFSPAGEQKVLDDVFAFMSQYLTVKVETPPKFLGLEYDGKEFRLTVASYLLKTYQNERGPVPPFRRYPNMGWVEKRKLYSQIGYPIIGGKVIPEEDRLLKEHGAPWVHVLSKAIEERDALNRENALKQSYFSSAAYLLGKADYLIDHETKVKVGSIGGYTGFTPRETTPIVKYAVNKELSAMLTGIDK